MQVEEEEEEEEEEGEAESSIEAVEAKSQLRLTAYCHSTLSTEIAGLLIIHHVMTHRKPENKSRSA